MANTSAQPYDLLLLDFGGVCLLSPVEMHHVAEAKLKLPQGTFTWRGPVDPDSDALWRELTTGSQLREREYWTRLAAEVGIAAGTTMTVKDYMDLLYTPPSDSLVRPGCHQLVERSFAAGISVSVLTNDLRAYHGNDWEKGISLLGRVDHIVDCSDTGILKPDPRAYDRALTITGFDASHVLFVDDQQLSVQGARECGIDAVWFDISAPDASWAKVAALLGL